MADTEKKWVQCREGWISYKRAGDGYYVTASGHRAATVTEFELRGVLDELARALGGRVIRRVAY